MCSEVYACEDEGPTWKYCIKVPSQEAIQHSISHHPHHRQHSGRHVKLYTHTHTHTDTHTHTHTRTHTRTHTHTHTRGMEETGCEQQKHNTHTQCPNLAVPTELNVPSARLATDTLCGMINCSVLNPAQEPQASGVTQGGKGWPLPSSVQHHNTVQAVQHHNTV